MIIQKGFTVWLTGISASENSELAEMLEGELLERGLKVELVDENNEPVKSKVLSCCSDYNKNAGALAEIARLLARNEVITIVSAVSPSITIRNAIRTQLGDFIEVYVKSADQNIDKSIVEVYEVPEKPEVLLESSDGDNDMKMKKIIRTLELIKWIPEGFGMDYSSEEETQIQERLESLGYL